MGRAERGGEPGCREHQQGACVDPWVMGLFFEKESPHQPRKPPRANQPNGCENRGSAPNKRLQPSAVGVTIESAAAETRSFAC